MCKVLIFGGTTEGRKLAEYCAVKHIPAVVSVVSGYGEELLPESSYIKIEIGARPKAELVSMIRFYQPELVMDATHPHAKIITATVQEICQEVNIPYCRVLRKEAADQNDCDQQQVVWVQSISEAVQYLNQTTGAVLATTGSKELALYRQLNGYQERLFARVLPSAGAIEQCQLLGLKGRQIIGMQGPFSKELNIAMMKQLEIKYLVTKEAGSQGGFAEKISAAKECGAVAIVIGRPVSETGISLAEAFQRLLGLMPQKRQLALIGIGMGGKDHLTFEAVNILKESEAVFGAGRVLASVSELLDHAVKNPIYESDKILQWLEEHQDIERAAVVFSGDTGFYSGARQLADRLSLEPWRQMYECRVLPGISSLSYFSSILKISWQNLLIASVHGRDCNLQPYITRPEDIFLLLGNNMGAAKVCGFLVEQGYGELLVTVGERLSYQDQKIVTAKAKDLVTAEFDPLSVMLIRKMKGI